MNNGKIKGIENIYKLYNIGTNYNYAGNQNKVYAELGGQPGIFKLPMRSGSKDHIVEVINYQLGLRVTSS